MIKNHLIDSKIIQLSFANRTISRYVKCSDTVFELLIILEFTNAQLKEFYSLNFNINEKSLMLFKKENIEHV